MYGRRNFTTKRVSWIRSLKRKLQWRKRMREKEKEKKWHGNEGKTGREVEL